MAEQAVVVVRGEATREVPPDQAVFSVTVQARDKDRQATLARLTERAEALRDALDLHAEVIERRETTGVQIHPEIKRQSERVVAYSGNVTTTVTVTDFTVLGDLLLKLGDMDQTVVSGPWWQLQPGSTAGSEVRRAAITDALAHARDYAAAVGARVDRLLEISDPGTDRPMYAMAARATNLSADGAEFHLEVDPQPQTVSAAVIVRVAITEPTLEK